jgi:[NiFe] hydrogenase diaphorase moiety small subunit
MSETITFTIDGVEVKASAGQTILNAADAAGIYIPRLCWLKEASTDARCRVCTVLVNGRPQAACVFPASNGLAVQNDIPELQEMRKQIIEMLFVEGNHFCMFCEMSGKCELQALGYRLGMTSPRYPFLYPKRSVDASHPDVWLDRNRCILCGRCVAASSAVDKKNVFQFVNRGAKTELGVNSAEGLGGTNLKLTDKAVEACPVGALLKKRTAYAVPIGQRPYDKTPIGSEIEAVKK